MEKKRGFLARLWRLALLVIILVGFWYFENRTIATETFQVTSDRLPAAFDGLRVVELADLHGEEFGPGHRNLVEAVQAAKPDLIALDGDLADEHTDLEVIRNLAGELVKIAPTYYVTGNHEWAMDRRKELFAILEEAGVTALHNEYVLLERDGQSIVVAGVDDPNGPWDQKTPEELTEEIHAACGDPYVLLLAHRNDQLARWDALELDAVLAGHAHGGVIRLPVAGGLLGTGMQFFPEYTAGIYRAGRTCMLVSRGLGNSGIPFRLFNRPHLPVVVLRSGKGVNNP